MRGPARNHRHSVATATCGALLSIAVTLAGASPARADTVRVLDSDLDAAQARIDLIQQAENEILAAYYIFGIGWLQAKLA